MGLVVVCFATLTIASLFWIWLSEYAQTCHDWIQKFWDGKDLKANFYYYRILSIIVVNCNVLLASIHKPMMVM